MYAAFAAAFFPQRSALVFLALYALGIGTAVGAAKLLGCMGRQEAAPFVMELPDYRWPDAHSVLRRMRQRTREFLARAFTVILAASIGVWVLRTFTPAWRVAANADESLLAAAGRMIAPVFQPLGFGDWRAATALVTGLLAKETVLSTLGVLLGGELTAALPQVFSPRPPQAFSCSRRCMRRAWRRRRPCARSSAADPLHLQRRRDIARRPGAPRQSFTASRYGYKKTAGFRHRKSAVFSVLICLSRGRARRGRDCLCRDIRPWPFRRAERPPWSRAGRAPQDTPRRAPP